jgi:hypothetical protein
MQATQSQPSFRERLKRRRTLQQPWRDSSLAASRTDKNYTLWLTSTRAPFTPELAAIMHPARPVQAVAMCAIKNNSTPYTPMITIQYSPSSRRRTRMRDPLVSPYRTQMAIRTPRGSTSGVSETSMYGEAIDSTIAMEETVLIHRECRQVWRIKS